LVTAVQNGFGKPLIRLNPETFRIIWTYQLFRIWGLYVVELNDPKPGLIGRKRVRLRHLSLNF
jgi:hypothetical protein